MRIAFLLIAAIMMVSCHKSQRTEEIKNEIFQVEKAFEKMATEKGIAEAFYFFADEDAVIKRGNDSLITGKENIKLFYGKINNAGTTVNWSPDFIDIARDGSLAYTYGKYVWKIKNEAGISTEHKGVFHTVWKKQKDNSWKYVWD
ncbi:MAG: hypothetical protein RLZZ28_2074 [Bacteroidota bacterium]|jgi:ketosteroid isomerase-like protein